MGLSLSIRVGWYCGWNCGWNCGWRFPCNDVVHRLPEEFGDLVLSIIIALVVLWVAEEVVERVMIGHLPLRGGFATNVKGPGCR